ncbi:MAG: tryptophan 7-halogenase [Burkholderiales bacterium]
MNEPTMPVGKRRFDVVVAGGGPAGCTTAQLLARAGLAVALVERGDYVARRIGETLVPTISTVLAPLGLWEMFVALRPLASAGRRILWGEDEPTHVVGLFNPYGGGWHVDRAAFDRMLFDATSRAGVVVFSATRIEATARDASGWTLRIAPAGSTRAVVELGAALLVDATGRRASLARRFGAVRQGSPAMLATVTWQRWAEPSSTQALIIEIEATEAGWRYVAPQPNGERVQVELAQPRQRIDARNNAAASRVRVGAGQPAWACPGKAQRLAFHACRAESSLLEPCAGAGWLAVGDAALTIDPLSGDGVMRAMAMAGLAARSVVATLSGRSKSEVEAYQDAVGTCFRQYRNSEAYFYERERRWPQAPFWRERNRSGHALFLRH